MSSFTAGKGDFENNKLRVGERGNIAYYWCAIYSDFIGDAGLTLYNRQGARAVRGGSLLYFCLILMNDRV